MQQLFDGSHYNWSKISKYDFIAKRIYFNEIRMCLASNGVLHKRKAIRQLVKLTKIIYYYFNVKLTKTITI